MASSQGLVPLSHKCAICHRNKEQGAKFTIMSYRYIRSTCNQCRRLVFEGKIEMVYKEPINIKGNRAIRSKIKKRKLIRQYIADYFRLKEGL